MDFFDKLGKKASETYKVTAEKTGKLAKETKLKLKMGDLKAEVSDLYEEIGKKVYEKHELGKKSISFEKDLAEEIKKLESVTDEIAKINKECLALRDKLNCPNCHKEIDNYFKFCPNCGENLKNEKETNDAIEAEIIDDENKHEVFDGIAEDGKEESKKNVDIDKEESKKSEDVDKEKNSEGSKKKKENLKAKSNLEKTVEVESDVKKEKE